MLECTLLAVHNKFNLVYMMNLIIQNFETKGAPDCITPISLSKLSILNINIESDYFYLLTKNEKIEISIYVYSSITLWDLILFICKKINKKPEEITIKRLFNPKNFGKSLHCLKIENGDIIKISVSRSAKPEGQKKVIYQNGELTDEVKNIFTSVFRLLSTEKGLDKKGFMQFLKCIEVIADIWDDNPNAQNIFLKLDSDNDGYIQESDFLEFYRESSQLRLDVVWENLLSLNYNHQLEKGQNTPLYISNSDPKVNPRNILNENQDIVDILYENYLLSNNKKLAEETYKLLIKLHPSEKILKSIMNLKIELDCLNQEKNTNRTEDKTEISLQCESESKLKSFWIKFFNSDNINKMTYKLWYILSIMESLNFYDKNNINILIEGEIEHPNDNGGNSQFNEEKLSWIEDFTRAKGINFLLDLFLTTEYEDKTHFLMKKILTNIFVFYFNSNMINKETNKETNKENCKETNKENNKETNKENNKKHNFFKYIA